MKRAICFFMISAFIIALFPKAVSASSVTEGTFNYLPAFADTATERFYYSDGYFDISGKEDNAHLLSMSYCLALSTFELRGSTQVKKLFSDIGFGDTKVYDLDVKPTADTVGTAIAYKRINGFNVIAVAIRGKNYESEWASNFNVGEDGNAKGFDEASGKVLRRIKDYANSRKLKNNKLWIVGYSRAGAIADLAGVYINNAPEEFGVSKDGLYVYAFEPAAASSDSTVYENINVVICKGDVVPYVCPEGWGLHTNGKITYIGGEQTVMTYNGALSQTEYRAVDLGELLSETFDLLSAKLTRKMYASTLETYICDITAILYGKTNDELTDIISFVVYDLYDDIAGSPKTRERLAALFLKALLSGTDDEYRSLAGALTDCLSDARNGSKRRVLSDAEFETVKDGVYPLLRTLVPIIQSDTAYYDPKTQEKPELDSYHIASILKNAGVIARNHYPQVIFEYIKERDSYYTKKDGATIPATGDVKYIYAVSASVSLALAVYSAKRRKR